MKCEQYRELFIDWNDNTLGKAEQAEIEEHLNDCPACREEFAAMQLTWDDLGEIKTPEPSAAMQVNFQHMLDDFKRSADQQSRWSKLTEQINQLLQLRLPLAYSLLIVLVCVGGAYWLRHDNKEEQQLQALNAQVHELKQTMMLAMLDNPLASERIKAVSYTNNIKHVDSRIINALFETLNNDPNVNVRLSTLEALAQLGNHAEVRAGLVQSIKTQDSPLVQSAIADVMLKLQEKNSVKSFKELLKQKNLDHGVRDKINETITKLI